MVVIRGRRLLARSCQGLVTCLEEGMNPLRILRIADGKNNELNSGLILGIPFELLNESEFD